MEAIPALRRSGKTAHLPRIHRSGTRSAQHLAKPAHTTCISRRSMRRSSRGHSGACPMPTRRRLSNWSRSRRFGPRPSSPGSWRLRENRPVSAWPDRGPPGALREFERAARAPAHSSNGTSSAIGASWTSTTGAGTSFRSCRVPAEYGNDMWASRTLARNGILSNRSSLVAERLPITGENSPSHQWSPGCDAMSGTSQVRQPAPTPRS